METGGTGTAAGESAMSGLAGQSACDAGGDIGGHGAAGASGPWSARYTWGAHSSASVAMVRATKSVKNVAYACGAEQSGAQ